MTNWSLSVVLNTFHSAIQHRLALSRGTLHHAGTLGDASEHVWNSMFSDYLPKRYQALKGHVVDSDGRFSQQIDVIIFDRQYSPFILSWEGQTIVPAESVYAVFEAKQTANAQHVKYAQDKVASVRSLRRTSLPIPHAGGVFPAKPLIPILGGLLTLDSEWNPPLGEPFRKLLDEAPAAARLDVGCVASHGHYFFNGRSVELVPGSKPAAAFLFKLIAMLQLCGTVPMIDVEAYAHWLTK